MKKMFLQKKKVSRFDFWEEFYGEYHRLWICLFEESSAGCFRARSLFLTKMCTVFFTIGFRQYFISQTSWASFFVLMIPYWLWKNPLKDERKYLKFEFSEN